MAPTGGRRSSAGLNPNTEASSDWQVAASNSTLNTWVGRRQPSWLTNAKPVKPSPRHSQPPKQPTTTIETTPPIVTTTQTTQTTQAAQTTQTTSVTPESVPTAAPVFVPDLVSASPPPTSESHRLPHLRPSIHTPSSTAAANTVLPSPAPSDEPSPGVPEAQNAIPVTRAYFSLDDDKTGNKPKERPHIRVSSVRSSRTGRETSASPNTPTNPNMALNTPPTPNLLPTHVNITPQERSEQPVAKRRRVMNALRLFLDAKGAMENIQERIRSSGGEQALDVQIERPRFLLLLQACEDGDLFFVGLHQLFCTWTSQQIIVHRLCDATGHNPSLVDMAFGTMGTILKSNSRLSPSHIQWFSTFPAPLNDLMDDPLYTTILRQVLDFLMCVGHKWGIVQHEHQMNGHPILMTEFLAVFRLFSPILQAIMFRASRRSVGVDEGNAAVQMESLFKADQRRHLNPDGSFIITTPSPKYQEYNLNLVKKYKAIIHDARRQQQQQQQQQQPQQQPGAYQGIQQPIPPQPVRFQQQGSYNPHMNMGLVSQAQQNPNQIVQFNHFSPQLPTNSAPGASGAQFLYTQHTTNVQPNMSIQSSGSLFFPANANPSIVPSHRGDSINSMTPRPFIGSTSLRQPANVHPHQTQFSQHGSSVPLPHAGYSQHLTLLTQQHQQYPPGSASPQPVSNTGRPLYPMPLSGRQPQVFPQQSSNLVNQYNASFPLNGSVPNAQPARQPVHLVNNALPPNGSPQLSMDPQLRARTVVHDKDRFFPSPNMRISIQDYPHSHYDRRSVISSLHQAELRSPVRRPRELRSTERYYQAVKCFALCPVATPVQPYLHHFKFTVPESDLIKLSKDEAMSNMASSKSFPVNVFFDGSLRLRVRCCYRKTSLPAFSESDWVTTETIWPEHIFMELNKSTLGIRRKAHHSKDLPVEISSFIQVENSLDVLITQGSYERQGQVPYIAVEVVETLSHSTIIQMVKEHGLSPASVTEQIIKNRLGGSSTRRVDDDELAIADYLSIDLADPFSRTIFTIPVRGESCTHLECFDLELWLNTRLGKKSCYCGTPGKCTQCPKEPSLVDKWKCPLCNGDARPYSLRVDEFLMRVRSRLESEDKLHTKCILVSADGTWKPKEEPGDNESDVDSDEGGIAASPTKKPSRSTTTPLQHDKSYVEIVEIDDD